VYDTATLDLSTIEPGVTTGFDVNALLIQGCGDICAALDVDGAPSLVIDCPPVECLADAGTLTANAFDCLEAGGTVTLSALAGGDAVVPPGYDLIYILTQGLELVILDMGAEPVFNVQTTGLYTIHTLVYQPGTLDLSIVESGTITGFDVNALLIQGGGDICAALDVAGAAFQVETCGEGFGITVVNIWPVPARDVLHVALRNPHGMRSGIEVIDMQGRKVIPPQVLAGAEQIVTFSVADLPSGQYLVRIVSADGMWTERFVKF
jgi:hypothetical protein